jgi:MFS family permease
MRAPSPSRENDTPRGRLVTPLFALVTLSSFSFFTALGALQPVLPRFIKGPLGGTTTEIGLIVGAFSLAAILVRPLIAHIGDRRGRRQLLLTGGVLVGASVAGYLLVDNLWQLMALRIVAGVGEAFFYIGAASVINDLTPDERRGEALSYFSLALYGGLALGPIMGELALDARGYGLAWIVASAAAVLAALLGVPIPDTRPTGDVEPPRGLARIAHPAGLLPGVVLATSVWGLGGFNTFVPLLALEVGLSGSRLVFATFALVVILIRSLGARIPDRLGPGTSARSALAAQASGLLIMGLVQVPVGLYSGTILFALGQALAFPALMTLAVGGAPATERSSVVGTFTAFFDLAFGLGAIALGGIAEAIGYGGAFVSAAAVAVAGLVLLTVRAQRARRVT